LHCLLFFDLQFVQDKQTVNQRREDNAMAKRQDKQTINQRREDNAMAKRQDKQTINQRREDNVMAKRQDKHCLLFFDLCFVCLVF
jgi:hypothetical protein